MVGIELLVGGWFASPTIKSLAEKAQKYLGANYQLQKDTQEIVEALILTLSVCQATVTEAEKIMIINNQPLADLLRNLKLVADEAEDVLDNMETQSIKDKVKAKNMVSKLASSSLSTVSNIFLPEDNLKSLKRAMDKLNQLSSKIPDILNLINMNIKNESQTKQVTDSRETISQSLEEARLYGRDDELNLILDSILGTESESSKKGGQNCNNYHGIFVIPIVGMGGVGKTALAQAVYNNSEVKETFSKRAWVSVSNNFDVKWLMSKIYESCKNYPDFDSSHISLESISWKIQELFQGLKFLIVLDDMFESQWDFVHKFLSRGAPGSVVLITTQNQVFANRVVANTVGAFGPIALNALESGKFRELFEHFAFRNVVMSEEKRIILKSIGNEIADKLHGLPLAAKIIGNVLNSNLDEHKWRDISKSEWWHIPEGKTQILPSIGLCYEQLDPCLRECFAYCSLFPRNSLIEKDRLVHMWIALNFIPSNVDVMTNLEDIGSQWFDELVKKSFFEHAGDNNSYVMHELMHDLAVIVSSKECFYLGEGVDRIPSNVRHLAVDTNNLEVINGIREHKNLRSFLYFGCCQVKGMYSAINNMLTNLDSLRVLDLSYMHMEKEDKPPTAIWNFQHLHFLDLHMKRENEVNEPPTAIWNLQHLRFLDLSSTGINSLTHSEINLYHLQALYIRKCSFKKIPKGINKLINLRHLRVENETLAQISGIGQLTNLQELDVFHVGKQEGHRITELRNLREIRGTLRIQNTENIKNRDEAMQAKLVDKHLDSIHIIKKCKNRNFNEGKGVLQELQPNKGIKDLRIESYDCLHFPNWIIQIGDSFLNLNTLCLSYCVNVKRLPPLGELPSLKHLQIRNFESVKLIDSDLYGKKQTVFPLLEELVLDRLFKCEEWTGAGAKEFFPRLSKLTITLLRTLRKAPLHLFSSTLKELLISECSNLISGNSCSVSASLDPHNMPFLEDLYLFLCPKLKIKGGLQSLTHLKRLTLEGCFKLFSTYSTRDQQKGKGLQVHQDAGLRSLTYIKADGCLWDHDYHHLILGSLPSLRVLYFGNSKRTRFTNHQILWFQEMTALKEIYFTCWKFEHLPASLIQLSALKKMKLDRCTRLESLSDSMAPNLQELTLDRCSRNLVQWCQPPGNISKRIKLYQPNWGGASIPVIHIDDYTHRKNELPTDAARMEYMEIGKPQISDAIGRQQECTSCSKILELRDLVLRTWR